MENLNEFSLAEAIHCCYNYPGYQVIIVMNDRLRLVDFLDWMREYLKDDDFFRGVSKAGIIQFKNGSYIRPVMCDSRVRGLGAHMVIYDEGVTDMVIYDEGVMDLDVGVGIRKFIYHLEENASVTLAKEDDPVTLDDFLGKFKIV